MGSTDTPVPYDPPTKFGQDSKGFTIGLKRDSKIARSPGPGDFETDASLIKGGPYISERDDYYEKNFSVNQSFTKTPQKTMDVYSQSGFNRKKSANISPNKNRLSDTQNQYIQRTGSTMKNGTKSAKKIKM